MTCPQTIRFKCVGKFRDRSLQWLFDDKIIGNYTDASSDTFPYRVSGAPEGVAIVIVSASLSSLLKRFNVTSTLTTDTSRLNVQSVGCGPDGSDLMRRAVDFRCVDVFLQANRSLQGDICPVGAVEFKCSALNLKSLLWYFGDDRVVDYDPSSSEQFPVDLCQHPGMVNKLADLCKYGGSLVINSAKKNGSAGGYDITSTLVAKEVFISLKDYNYLQCGCRDSKALTLTNFYVSSNESLAFDLQLTANSTNLYGGLCEGLVEVKCVGTDLASFQWMYNNNQTLTDAYIYSSDDTFPHSLHSSLSEVTASVSSADTENDLIGRCNFVSTLGFNLTDLPPAGVHSLECSSAGELWKQISINCELSCTV